MNEKRARSIAVVVVHGVADQKPRESARQIANLLTDFTGAYPSGFPEQAMRVPLQPADCMRAPTPKKGLLAEIFSFQDGKLPPAEANAEAGEMAFAFMDEQLRDYVPGDEGVFETICLEGKRDDGAVVHIYEAYWADLSRLGTGLVKFIGELYQLLLHIPTLGRKVVDRESVLRRRGEWRLFEFMQRWLVRWLTLFIAPINLVMSTFILPLMASQLRGNRVTNGVAVGLAALMMIAVTGLILRKRPQNFFVWSIGPLVAAAIAVAVTLFFVDASSATHVLMFELWLLSALLIGLVLISYNERRPGTLGIGGAMLLIVGVLFAWQLGMATSLAQAALRVVEIANIALQLVWRLHILWLLLTMIVAAICVAASRSERRRAVRAAWIAVVSAGLASTVFAILTPAVWAAILRGTPGLIPNDEPFQWLELPSWLYIKAVPDDLGKTVGSWINHAVITRASGVFVLETAVVLAFLFALVWSIFPSVMAEARPPRSATEPRRMLSLGRWLSHGLRAIPWSALVVPVGLVALPVLYVLGLDQISATAVWWAGGAIIALIAARFWLPGASSALDVGLDVDNYLRRRPRRSTPRARIAERFTSLLRFIHASPRSYDATVIIAHSQGSVITADLLRYLQRADATEPLLGGKPVRFFTMGCPLRQLYARAFSPLYLWMDPDVQTTTSSATIPYDAKPDPNELGVEVWVNAYRTGDYVGRNLWCNRTGDELWTQRRDMDPQGRRIEICIGAGAHTHYWDRNGEEIADVLDDLIVTP